MSTSSKSNNTAKKKRRSEALEKLIKDPGAVREISERDLNPDIILWQTGAVNGNHKTRCAATAVYYRKVKEIHPEYCALPQKERKHKRVLLEERILKCDDLKGKSFVQYDDYDHDDSGNKLRKFYLLNLENENAKLYVLSKIAQACRDVTKIEKKKAKKTISSKNQNQENTYVPAHISVPNYLSEVPLSNNHSSSPSDHFSLGAQSGYSCETSVSGVKRKDRDMEEEEVRNNAMRRLDDCDISLLDKLFRKDTTSDNNDTENENNAVREVVGNTNNELAQVNYAWDSLDLDENFGDLLNHLEDFDDYDISLLNKHLRDDTSDNDDTENERNAVTEKVANTNNELAQVNYEWDSLDLDEFGNASLDFSLIDSKNYDLLHEDFKDDDLVDVANLDVEDDPNAHNSSV